MVQHTPRRPLDYPQRQLARVWTAPPYVAAEDAHLVEARRREQEQRWAVYRARAAKRRAGIDASNAVARAAALERAAVAERQVRLAPSGPVELRRHVLGMNRGVRQATAHLAREHGIAAEIGWSVADLRWAAGTPLIGPDAAAVAVFDPAPSLVKGEAFRLLAGMLLLFTTAADMKRFDRATRRPDPLLRETRMSYDALGHLTGRILPDGSSESWTYDNDGNLSSHTAPARARSSYSYDTLGRLTSTTDPAGPGADLPVQPDHWSLPEEHGPLPRPTGLRCK
ncbi:RHS repeat domain-containing protein [Kitasatospora purpeofusca]|uniref:RHS repeat domain-containing protein n=1 Tax=Kitasatospora purpeofusca TaxID=67352 RepID=UPI0037F21FCC